MSSDENAEPESKTPWYTELHWQILIGLIVALIFSIAVRHVLLTDATDATLATMASLRQPFAFVGELFLRLLKLIVIPLLVFSVIAGIQSLGDAASLGRVGLRTIAYYMTTTLLAVIAGIVVVNLFKPGVGLNMTVEGEPELEPKPILEVFRDIVPENFFAALAAGDMLPTIFCAIVIGLALLSLSAREVEPLTRFVDAANTVVFRITDWVMITAPVGVSALFVATLLDPALADLTEFFGDLGAYMAAVVTGLGFHAIVTLPLILFLVTRRNPFEFAKALSPALLTAFSTASSSATYPVTHECVTDRADVPKKSADFVLPLGATINMDGTALYEAVAAVFIANAIGFDLTFGQQVIIVLTSTLAAIGAAGVPSAGLVTMIIVLESVGLPAAGYGLVVAVDRILDMCRTSVNVWGDSVGAAVVAHGLDDPPG